ncbi:glycosyltransferase family 90 protein [Emericellopsis atlantica]|uniref:Glycosyltransferase family 90 protein n=1 Tax=Emericellopsis atlantica TaxID=2614577 RepID=A0A9P8CSI3_9HYPO|nr:glycosyltransferase family 90 protein [Emericellopsis atlantica]KAG9255781.1 glycosyltransferase family 90 protein [Emericellopsis atlantica]
MRITDSRQALSLLSLLGLALGSWRLSSRFYISASFERPVFFTVITLLACSVILQCRAQWSTSHGPPLEVVRLTQKPALRVEHKGLFRVAARFYDTWTRLHVLFRTLLVCLIARTILFWYTLRKAQCGWIGIEAFLPFATLAASQIITYATDRLGGANLPLDRSPVPRQSKRVVYTIVAFAWALCSMWALGSLHIRTGAVCPVGWRVWPLTPLLQMTMCLLDAVILAQVSRLRRYEVEGRRDTSKFLSALFMMAAAGSAIVAVSPILIEMSLYWTLRLNAVEIRDLLLDSSVAVLVVLCALALMAYLEASTLAFIIASLGLFGFRIPNLGAGPLLAPMSPNLVLGSSLAAALLTTLLVLLTKPNDGKVRASTTAVLHHVTRLGFLCIVGICAIWAFLLPPHGVGMALPSAINKLFQVAEMDAHQWAEKAAASKSLKDAVTEYRKRYSIAPPPNFDKWHEFATKHHSPIIDSFDQIHQDLLPFWGVEPVEIRAQTGHILAYSSLEMGGLRIRNGVLQQSPHIPGTHRWMAESLERMIAPFAQWLPDMDLAINLGDECRMTVPFEDKAALLEKATATRKTAAQKSTDGNVVSRRWPQKREKWPKDWVDVHGDFYESSDIPPDFSSNLRKPLYYEWVAPTCPAGSPARDRRWWDRSTACIQCAAPHSILTDEGAVMAHPGMANNLCYQPDLAYLDGFILAPTAVTTKKLLPIFSQSRVGGFSDILFPSPWNFNLKSEYEEAEDLAWEDKQNALFWRGTPSDGYAWDGTWTGFVRARLVNEGFQRGPMLDQSVGVNVSYAGRIEKCHAADYWAELATFTHWGKATLTEDYQPEAEWPLPPVTAFDEHWHYRHLIDVDGAGFSGRFLPFLQSKSVVYRAALFKTWYDERLREWHHYIPIDVRLGNGFWSVLRYLGSSERHDQSKHTGDEIAQKIATNGKEWASRALRPEDMQIYMFRLLLEWGRIVDDERENLGYVV